MSGRPRASGDDRLHRIAASLAEARRALRRGALPDLQGMLAELGPALAAANGEGAASRATLLLLADELDQLALEVGDERVRAREALAQLGSQARAHSAYLSGTRLS